MDEFELEDNLEFILQSIQELIEDQGENNPFGEVNQNELLANLLSYDQDNMMPDVSVADVVGGKDVQGIPWEKMLFPRDQCREMKMKGYKNYQNLSYAREDALQVIEELAYFRFWEESMDHQEILESPIGNRMTDVMGASSVEL